MQTKRPAIDLPGLEIGSARRAMPALSAGFLEYDFPVDLVPARRTGPILARVPAGVRVIDLGTGRMLASPPNLVRQLKKGKPAYLVSGNGSVNGEDGRSTPVGDPVSSARAIQTGMDELRPKEKMPSRAKELLNNTKTDSYLQVKGLA